MQSKLIPIDQQLQSSLAIQIAENRQKLHPVVKTIVFCGQQNIPLRGHHEGESSQSPGNFKALLTFRVESGDHILKSHMDTCSRNAVYTSKNIQNEIISVVGSWIQSKLLHAIQTGSKIFSIIADESRDCSNKEQMPLIIWYVNESHEIQESFMEFLECEHGTTGASIATLIENACQSLGLDLSMCRGQGYDGAGNMAGIIQGAAARIFGKYPKALYIHCASHKLNLCIARSCQLTSVTNMMDMVTCLANFFNYSPQRQKALEGHVNDYTDALKSKLIPLCRTRWVERLNALEIMLDLAQPVIDTLGDMAVNADKKWNRDTVTQASALLKRFDFEFVMNLVIVQKILAYSTSLTTMLQSKGIDAVKAYEEVNLVIRTLQHVRTNLDGFHQDCFAYASDLATKIDVEVKKPRTCRRQQFRQNAEITVGSNDKEATAVHFRINVTAPFLDEVLQNMKFRFDKGQAVVVVGFKLIPSCAISEPNLISTLQPFLHMYADDLPSRHTLNAEIDMWVQKWTNRWSQKWKTMQEQHKKATGEQMKVTASEELKLKQGAVPNNLASTLIETDSKFFPNIFCILNVLAVLPVTSCEVERCISSLRQLKTYLRSAMGPERLTGLALLHIHKDIEISIEEVIHQFAIKHPRRMRLCNILSD